MSDNKATLRRAQTITPFGVGALVDINGEGFAVASIDKWPGKPRKSIDMPRLAKKLGNCQLVSFSDETGFGRDSNEVIKVSRFPRWYHCAQCQRLEFILFQRDPQLQDSPPCCTKPSCKNETMTPMRFVAYCDNGHMSDIDWFSWCHRSSDAGKGHCNDRTQLYFKTSGRGGGDFNNMYIQCDACGRKEDLTDVQQGKAKPWQLQSRPVKNSKGQGKCCGKQPWQLPSEAESCEQMMSIEPRGSSSIYRGNVYSAIDIETPDGSGSTSKNYESLDELFLDIEDERTDYGSSQLWIAEIKDPEGDYSTKIGRRAGNLGLSFEEAVDYLVRKAEGQGKESQPLPKEASENLQEDLLSDELQVFRQGKDINTEHLRVRFLPIESGLGLASRVFSSIGQVKRLREVRTLVSFARGKALNTVPVDMGAQSLGWLPSIEAIGEGIYLEINPVVLQDYLATYQVDLDALVKGQQEALKSMQEHHHLDIPDSTLFIIAHSLAHLLIRQLTFNSGYSSSALRERLYVDDATGYAGILIYTTDTDSEGTLGGLVDQGRPEVIHRVAQQVREAALWCSADPVCRETESQGFKNLNRSACHCCSLISETSCMFQNAMLNRLTLGGMGQAKGEVLGFLEYAATRK